MIKNIIFDVAGVLVDFKWKERFKELGVPEEEIEPLAAATLNSRVWPEFDRGVWSDDEVLLGLIKDAPEKEQWIRLIWDRVSVSVTCRSYTRPWIRFLKEQGYHVYLLSNWPGKIYDERAEELSFEKETDGAIFSYRVKMIKPDREIYEKVLSEYGLKAEECVFIDDTKINLPVPESMGIHTIQFVQYEQVVKDLEKLGVPAFLP